MGLRVDVLAVPLRHVRRHPGRALLVVSVASIGVALVVSLSALLAGLEQVGTARLRNVGARVVRVYQGGLTPEDVDAIAALTPRPARLVAADGVPAIAALDGASFTGGPRAPVTILATTPTFRDLFDFPLAAGRFLAPGDGDGVEPGCVLDGALARRLFEPATTEAAEAAGAPSLDPPSFDAHPFDGAPLVGRRLRVRIGPIERAFTIRGVLVDLLNTPAAGVAYAFPQRNVYVDRALVRPFMEDRTSGLLVEAAAPADVRPLMAAIEDLGAKRWGPGPRRTHAQLWALDASESFDHQIQQLGAALAIVTLASCIVTLTTLQLLALRARLEEVAIRVIEGATPGTVALQFVGESLLLAGLGGALGIPLGHAIGLHTAAVVGWPAVFTPGISLLALGSAVLTGLLSGAAPAWKAARADPVAGLRVAMDVGR